MVNMTAYHSRQAYILIGKETVAWGTAAAATKDIGLVQNSTVGGRMNYTRAFSLSDTDTQSIDSGRFDGTGSLEVIFQHGRLLEYITGGTVSHTATNDPDIKHEYVLSDTKKSFSMEDGFDSTTDVVLGLTGCVLNSLTLAMALDGYLRMRADYSYKNIAVNDTSATSAVVSTLAPFKDFMANLSFGTASSEVAKAVVQSFELTFNNVSLGEPRIYGMESKLAGANEWNGKTIDFRFSLAFQDNSEWAAFLGATTGVLDTGAELATYGLILNLTNGVTVGSGLRQVYIDLSSVVIDTISKPTAIGGWVIQDISGFAKTIDSMYSYDTITSANWG
jgi:hypothetical protein